MELLNKVERPSLYVMRIKRMAIEVYKTLHGLNPPFMQELFQNKMTSYNLRNPSNLVQPRVRTTGNSLESFSYAGTKIWNSLPYEFKLISNSNSV